MLQLGLGAGLDLFDLRGLEAQTLPGVLVIDGLVASLLRSTVGSSKMRVIFAFDVADVSFSSDEFITFSASPSAGASALVLEKAAISRSSTVSAAAG